MAFRIGPEPVPHPRFRSPPGAGVNSIDSKGQRGMSAKDQSTGPTLFEQLLPVTWRDIAFPISSMRVSLSQDLTQHKYWGVDGASVEATGRAPLEIEAVIPFVNGIVPGKGEKWGVLYPTTFREFLKSFAERKTGILIHPELGEITCKPVSLDLTHDAQQRDGVTVTARWIETRLENDDGLLAVGESPIKVAELAALDLDASKTDLLGLVPEAEWQDETFESLINKVTGFVDSVGTTVKLLQAKPGQILYRVQRLQNSIQRTKNALTWPVEAGLEILKDAYHKFGPGSKTVYGTGTVQTVPLPPTKKIGRYVTPSRMTVSAIAASIPGSTVDDLIQLNPILVSKPEVGAQTVIRYYA